MKLSSVLPVLGELAPLDWAESWDNVGLLLGDPDQRVSRVLLTIDFTDGVADEAVALGAELVVSYHPPIFGGDGLKRVVAPSLVYRALRSGLAVYSPHTALDAAVGGTNDVLGDVLGLIERRPLRPLALPPKPERAGAGGPSPSGSVPGMGRVGTLAPLSRGDLIARIKEGLGLAQLLVAGPREGVVSCGAACAGACGNLLDAAIAAGAELYLTGELRHHDALRAARAGITVVCALHSNSERVVLSRVAARLQAALPGLEMVLSQRDRDPLAIV